MSSSVPRQVGGHAETSKSLSLKNEQWLKIKKWLAKLLSASELCWSGRKAQHWEYGTHTLDCYCIFVSLVVSPLGFKLCEDVYEHLHLVKIFMNICIWFVTQGWYLMVTINPQTAIFFQRWMLRKSSSSSFCPWCKLSPTTKTREAMKTLLRGCVSLTRKAMALSWVLSSAMSLPLWVRKYISLGLTGEVVYREDHGRKVVS